MPLSAHFHTGNRKFLQSSLKDREVIVITAHARLQKSADTTFFHQDRDFLYLTGIDEPDWVLVITPAEEFLIAPKLHKVEKLFDGGLDHTQAAGISGVTKVFEGQAGWLFLKEILKQAKEVQTIQHDDKLWFRTTPNPAHRRLIGRLKARTKAPIVSIHPQLHKRRAVKQSEEITALKRAIAITGEAMAEVKSKLKTYEYEYEVAADLTAGFLRRGSPGHAFEPIVASGKNTCTVHYIANNQKLDKPTFLLMDIGAEFDGYAADISRVYALSKPTQRQIDLHAAVYSVQQAAVKLIKPGVKFAEYFTRVDELMGEQLIKLKLIDTPTRSNVRQYFPYGVSHLLGLDVHDVGTGGDQFEEGMVVTVEPGIHVPEERLGVRLEDDVLVTKSGSQNLSKHISSDL